MRKLNIIIPVFILALTCSVCGYTKTYADINPIEIINRINGVNSAPANSPQKSPEPNKPQTAAPANKPVSANSNTVVKEKETVVSDIQNKDYLDTNPLEIVKNPAFYIGKKIKFRAKFDKFSTLGLDYNPAKRSSEDFITVLIQRPDILTHDIPLSELKIFMNRKEAEKHIDLNSGDDIEIAGKVFAKALGDAWMDVDNFTVIKTYPKANK